MVTTNHVASLTPQKLPDNFTGKTNLTVSKKLGECMTAASTIKIIKEYKLSEEEKTEAAKDGIRLAEAYDKHNEDFKDDRAQWRKELKDLKTSRDAKHKAFLTGTEMREYECSVHINMETKKAEYIHVGTVIETRDLTVDEIEKYGQKPMFDAPPSEITQVMKEETRRGSKKDLVTGTH